MRRAGVVALWLVLANGQATADAVVSAAGDPGPAAAQSLLVVIPVDYEGQIGDALVLAESIRTFAGTLAEVPVTIYAPSRLAPALAEQEERLTELAVGTRTVEVPRRALDFVLGAKPFTAAQAERDADDVDLVAVVAPNTIVLQPPLAFLLPATADLGWSTVHHQNVGSLASKPPDGFWSRLYTVLGVRREQVFTNQTLAEDATVRFYFNAGSFVVRPEHGLLQRWSEAFHQLIADQEMAELCADGPWNVFLHQAALAGAALASLEQADTVRLPDTYSYPLLFERFHGGPRTFDSLEGVVTMRREFRSEDLPPGWEHGVTAPSEVLAWIIDRLARINHRGSQRGARDVVHRGVPTR